MKENSINVPIWEKCLLSVEEATAYFGIGVNKIREMTASKDCKYVVWNGSKRMVKRVPFKEYLENQYSI